MPTQSHRMLVTVLAAASIWTSPAAGQVARLQIISGDRQILVNSFAPNQPYVVRAFDAEGKPVQGATLVMVPDGNMCGSVRHDEFGWMGFNTLPAPGGLSLCDPYGPRPTDRATTDENGIGSSSRNAYFPTPSAFLFSVSHYPGQDAFPPVFFSAVMVGSPPPGNPSVVVEYFDEGLDHYFNTLDQTEIDALEANVFPGWLRSIGSFIAYATAEDAPPGAVPVCRFFSPRYTSHFYTADPDECDAVIAQWPDVWQLESRSAFYINVPDKATGACPSGMQPVYRLYNDRPDPNHRYVTDAKLRDWMRNSSWIPEGYGPDSVIMCTPK